MTVRKKLLIPVAAQAFVVVLVLGFGRLGSENLTSCDRTEHAIEGSRHRGEACGGIDRYLLSHSDSRGNAK